MVWEIYAKTIQENQERRWGAGRADNQCSPLFTYNQITRGVNTGIAIQDHMVLMQKLGAAPFRSMKTCTATGEAFMTM